MINKQQKQQNDDYYVWGRKEMKRSRNVKIQVQQAIRWPVILLTPSYYSRASRQRSTNIIHTQYDADLLYLLSGSTSISLSQKKKLREDGNIFPRSMMGQKGVISFFRSKFRSSLKTTILLSEAETRPRFTNKQ